MWSLITGRERALTAAQRIIKGRFGRQRTSAPRRGNSYISRGAELET
jgi:hypothetical protein